MKSKNLIWLLVVALAPAAHAGTFTISSGTLNVDIPDFDVNGYQSSLSVTPGSQANDNQITGVTVTLNISGGYNGDLYGYLRHVDPNNNSTVGFTVLLNRIGQTGGDFGSSGSGLTSVVLDDAAGGNIHSAGYTAGVALTGTFKPDGSTLNVNPSDPNYLNSNDGSAGSSTLGNFNGLGADGTWTLFLADVSGGAVSTLVSWSATITAVPEPVNCALGIFGALGLGTVLFRRKK